MIASKPWNGISELVCLVFNADALLSFSFVFIALTCIEVIVPACPLRGAGNHVTVLSKYDPIVTYIRFKLRIAGVPSLTVLAQAILQDKHVVGHIWQLVILGVV